MNGKFLFISNVAAKIFLISAIFGVLVVMTANPTPAHREISREVQNLTLEKIDPKNVNEEFKKRQEKIQEIQKTPEGSYISRVEFAGMIAKIILWFGLVMAAIGWVRRQFPKIEDKKIGWMAAAAFAFGLVFASFFVQIFNNLWIGESPFVLIEKSGIFTYIVVNIFSLSMTYFASGLMAKIIINRQKKRQK